MFHEVDLVVPSCWVLQRTVCPATRKRNKAMNKAREKVSGVMRNERSASGRRRPSVALEVAPTGASIREGSLSSASNSLKPRLY